MTVHDDSFDPIRELPGGGTPLPSGAIARTWHGTTSADNADAYLELMRTVALPDYRATPGCLAAYTFVRRESETTHFLMVTFWESEEAIAAFAGERIEVAKFYDFDADFLVVKESTAVHYEAYDR